MAGHVEKGKQYTERELAVLPLHKMTHTPLSGHPRPPKGKQYGRWNRMWESQAAFEQSVLVAKYMGSISV